MTRRKSFTTIILCSLFGLLIGGLFGCEQPQGYYKVDGMTIQTFEFESCEYLKTGVHNGYAITHKGNCKNPIHQK